MMRVALTGVLSVAMTGQVLASAGGGGEAGSSSVFAGTLAQSIAAVVVFMILLALLWKAAWGPILRGLQDRESKIKADLEQAETAARQANATLEQYKARLAEAQAEARRIIDEGRAAADRIAQQIKAQAQADIEQMRKRAENDIRTARQQAISDIYAQTAALATQVAGRILQRQIDPADQQRLVQESLEELARSNN